MSGIGSYLKRERELRGISLEEISKVTKIGLRILKALESDDFDSLPAPIFVKGFIRSYATYVGLDPVDAVLRYEDYLARHEAKDEVEEIKEERRRTIPVPAVIGAILIIASSIYILSSYKGSTERAVEAPVVEDELKGSKEEMAAPISPEQLLPKEAEVEERKEIPHTIRFKARDRTWIKVVIDGLDTKEVLLKPGEEVKWEAKKGFFVVIGNAGGVDVVFDGRTLKELGEPGRVVRLSLPE